MNKTCQDIAEEKHGFSFGESWRYSEDSLTALLPILRDSSKKPGVQVRTYLLLKESSKAEIRDTGNINRVEVYNGDKLPVYIRMGEIFTGKTQERMAVRSYVVMPKEKVQVEVKCVYASKGISVGADMASGGIAPGGLDKMCASASFKGNSVNQRDVWDNVSSYSLSCSASLSSLRAGSMSIRNEGGRTDNIDTDFVPDVSFSHDDDLKSNMETFSKVIDKIFEKVPYFENQVGIATIDLKGVSGIECFDLKESWKALKDDIIKKEGENLSKEQQDSPFEYKKGKAVKVVKNVLQLDFEEKVVFKSKDYNIISIKKDDYVGEIVEFKGELLHLLIVKK